MPYKGVGCFKFDNVKSLGRVRLYFHRLSRPEFEDSIPIYEAALRPDGKLENDSV